MVKRRKVLAGAAGAFGLYVGWGDQLNLGGGGSSASGTIAPSGATSGLRWGRFRPLGGGSAVTIEQHDESGTVAGGINGPNGELWAVTCRHVVDPGYPDSDESEVIGTAVYQPGGGSALGPVVDVGPSKGADATDWAVFRIDDGSSWSSQVLGIGPPAGRGSVSVGERVICSGLRTGLIGGEITDVGVSANWSGTILYDTIEYVVDDAQDTAGNSGGWIGTVDEQGAFRPVGIHAFRVDDRRYAIPLSQCVDGADGTIVDDGSAPSAGGTEAPYIEGALGPIQPGGATVVQLANLGTESVTDRTIELRDTDGNPSDSTTVNLGALDYSTLTLTAPESEPVVLATGDETRQQSLGE